jgi:ribosome-associated protein
MTWDISGSSACSSSVKERFCAKYSRFFVDGQVVISSQRYRKQGQNIDDCIKKLEECLNDVRLAPKSRRATKPTRSSVKKRLDGKTQKSKLKKMRGEKF